MPVAADRHGCRVEKALLAFGRPPIHEVAAVDRRPRRAGMPTPQPPHHPMPRIVIEVAECGHRHPVLEVVAPSTQHRVDPAEQDGQGWMRPLAGEHPHLVEDAQQRLLRRVRVDHLLVRASLEPSLDAEPQEVEALVDNIKAPAQTERRQEPGSALAVLAHQLLSQPKGPS